MTTLLTFITPVLLLAGASAVNWAVRPGHARAIDPPAPLASPHH